MGRKESWPQPCHALRNTRLLPAAVPVGLHSLLDFLVIQRQERNGASPIAEPRAPACTCPLASLCGPCGAGTGSGIAAGHVPAFPAWPDRRGSGWDATGAPAQQKDKCK